HAGEPRRDVAPATGPDPQRGVGEIDAAQELPAVGLQLGAQVAGERREAAGERGLAGAQRHAQVLLEVFPQIGLARGYALADLARPLIGLAALAGLAAGAADARQPGLAAEQA